MPPRGGRYGAAGYARRSHGGPLLVTTDVPGSLLSSSDSLLAAPAAALAALLLLVVPLLLLVLEQLLRPLGAAGCRLLGRLARADVGLWASDVRGGG